MLPVEIRALEEYYNYLIFSISSSVKMSYTLSIWIDPSEFFLAAILSFVLAKTTIAQSPYHTGTWSIKRPRWRRQASNAPMTCTSIRTSHPPTAGRKLRTSSTTKNGHKVTGYAGYRPYTTYDASPDLRCLMASKGKDAITRLDMTQGEFGSIQDHACRQPLSWVAYSYTS